MTVQLSVPVRNRRLDSIEVETGVSALLTLRTGAQPANCATANSGTVVASMTLPSDWMGAASGGTKALAGAWSDASADTANTVGHFRIHTNDGANCTVQGSVTNTGGGGDMTLDNNIVGAGQTVTITTFTLTDGNA
jgi:hypothetical protein